MVQIQNLRLAQLLINLLLSIPRFAPRLINSQLSIIHFCISSIFIVIYTNPPLASPSDKARGRAKGTTKGTAKGKTKGTAKGKAKGRAKGTAKGKAKGRAKGKSRGREAENLQIITKWCNSTNENGPADFPARPLSSKPPTYPLELVRASRPRSIPLPWRVASFPKGINRLPMLQRHHNKERIHNPVEPGENCPSDVLLSVDNSFRCPKPPGPKVFLMCLR